ncbi:SRPBCC domain-containing protein [Cellulomonas sp. NS3]|uniref:SRPBCC domain-containing protein n=1 Tax=Cellulomonas sp. NS3 TaxID=2973977 RepID=UPI002162EEFE|nr:SRPBCC domain-containing protein [Cellulomonas sp. NS3]
MTSRMLDELGLLTAEGHEAQVRFERTFAVPPAGLWSALTEPSRVERWLGRLGGDLRVGGAYSLDMADDADADAVAQRATGEVLACDAPDRLLLTWHFPGEDPSEIEARVERRGSGSVLVVEHRRLTRGAARGYGAGWHTFLDHLGLLLVGREDEWADRFEELLPAYRGLLPAVGPVHVEVTGDRLVSADPAATAEFLHAWLGWTESGAASTRATDDDAARAGDAPDARDARDDGDARDAGKARDTGVAGAGAARVAGVHEDGTSSGPGRRVLGGVPGRAVLPVVERTPGIDDAPADATLTWSDVESLRESLVSAVGSGGRLAAGEPDDVGSEGAELVCPGDVRLRVRAEAGGAPAA